MPAITNQGSSNSIEIQDDLTDCFKNREWSKIYKQIDYHFGLVDQMQSGLDSSVKFSSFLKVDSLFQTIFYTLAKQGIRDDERQDRNGYLIKIIKMPILRYLSAPTKKIPRLVIKCIHFLGLMNKNIIEDLLREVIEAEIKGIFPKSFSNIYYSYRLALIEQQKEISQELRQIKNILLRTLQGLVKKSAKCVDTKQKKESISAQDGQYIRGISPLEAQANPDFWQFVETAYKRAAAQYLLQRWREKKQRKKLDQDGFFLRPSLSVVLESIHQEKINEVTEHIKNGRWDELHFDDALLPLEIVYALRMGRMNKNEAATAFLLKNAKEELGGKINFFNILTDLEASNRLLFNRVSGETNEHRKIFLEKVAQLSLPEQFFFTIDFSQSRTVAILKLFISNLITSRWASTYEKYFEQFFQCYSAQKKLAKQTAPSSKDYSIWLDILNRDPLCPNEDSPEYQFARMYIESTVNTNSRIIFPVISPNYSPVDPNSPIMSFPLLNMEALTHYYATLSPYAVKPLAIVGVPTTYDIDRMGRSAARPIEIPLPLVERHHAAHGFPVKTFQISVHDIHHSYRMSFVVNKSILYHFIDLLSQQTKVERSSVIWGIQDMDLPASEVSFDQHGVIQDLKVDLLFTDLKQIFRDFNFRHNNEMYLIMIDHAKNKALWSRLMGITISDACKFSDETFARDWSDLHALVTKYPDDSSEMIVLRYRLSRSSLSQYADNIINLFKLIDVQFSWKKDKDYSGSNQVNLCVFSKLLISQDILINVCDLLLQRFKCPARNYDDDDVSMGKRIDNVYKNLSKELRAVDSIMDQLRNLLPQNNFTNEFIASIHNKRQAFIAAIRDEKNPEKPERGSLIQGVVQEIAKMMDHFIKLIKLGHTVKNQNELDRLLFPKHNQFSIFHRAQPVQNKDTNITAYHALRRMNNEVRKKK